MAFGKRSMVIVLCMMVMVFCGACSGAVYKVGDNSGWTDSGKVDYKGWAASKNFRVGDTIVFIYDNRFSNVIRVTHDNYNACNNMHSYSSLNSGNDSFVIPRTGHFYFISGLPGHCQAGQRVNIRVPTATSSPAPAHVPAYAPAHVPAYEPAHAPAHAPAHVPAYEPAHAPAYEPAHAPAYEPAHAPAYEPAHAPAYEPAHAPGTHDMSPLGAPAPKKNGAVSISGMWLALVAVIAVSFYGLGF